MKDLQELASDIYGVLLLASMGGKDEDLAQAVREAGAKEEHVDLILKSARKIIEERNNHEQELNEILTRDYSSEDEAEKKAVEYLAAQGVNEQLINHILIYNTFVIVKAGTEELVAVAEEEGYSERQIKKIMRKEMGLDRQLADRIYDAATLSYNETTKEPPAIPPQKPVIEPQKPARGLLLSGIICLIIAYLSYQSPSAPDYISYTALILALVFLRIGMKRFMD
ncbi:MAG: hypothetical protein HEP71_20290 [Roseivirga sp.]|nr:hypothetical protein [Roseivirga sp.]